MIIEFKVNNVYFKGGIFLMVESVVNIKVVGEEFIIYNAIEWLLGKFCKEIEKLVQEILEGNLCGVLVFLILEQVNEDKIVFVKNLLEEVEDDLEKLGLVLDIL